MPEFPVFRHPPTVDVSTAAKPRAGVERGALRYDADTGGLFFFDGNDWVAVGSGLSDADRAVQAGILSELRRLRFGLETYLEREFIDPGE